MSANLPEPSMTQPRFKSLSTSTAEDWTTICAEHRRLVAGLPDRILAHMRLLDSDYGGFPVDRLQHSLQSALLAAEDGRDEEYVVCALLHDIGDTLGAANHPDVSAAIVQPFVSEANHWMIKHHGIFQGYNFFHHIGMDRNMRDAYRASPWFDYTAEFIAKYDDPAFDADQPRLELDLFAPMLRRVFTRTPNSIYRSLEE